MVALSSLAAVLAAGLSVSPFASFHLVKVKEVYPGSAAAPNAQYVMLQLPSPGENFVGGKEVRVFDRFGFPVATFTFPAAVPNGADQATILLATPEALTFFAPGPALTADLAMTPILPALGGKVCFFDPIGFGNVDCVSWGGYSGDPAAAGAPENSPVGLMRGMVLRRRMDVCGSPTNLDLCDDTDDSANDFTIAPGPAPRNNAGVNGAIPAATCGNGAVQSVEQCDDGNVVSGDGCQADCRLQNAVTGTPPFTPQALVVDPTAGGMADGNRVLEPGEEVAIQPGWRNVTAVPLALTSEVSRVTAPPNTALSLVDLVAAYGTVAPATTASCTAAANCLALAVAVSNPRPALHWELTASEVNSQYDFKTWSLHIGESFTDVPKSSPFYRFVETLLHGGITGGCSATAYCPAATTTRDAMAVFVLKAKDPLANPPACAPPNMFNDVPETSPFCRWIEALALAGVASGCGNGNYCPTAPVTREQMAVFVLRTHDPSLTPPPCPTPSMFLDVPASSPFCRWIEELARRSVVTGCGGGNYCPTALVTREQMGVFLTVTFGLSLYGV